ncbi:MAG: DUF4279 domain-containing protein [Anaerolineales bacterium]|nr:DUF4279 domain-containing protein [Anaerolineales bacterium]MCB8937904.1 DUF4279 domain-containing protein [Ardenticatenaceae bacterium]
MIDSEKDKRYISVGGPSTDSKVTLSIYKDEIDLPALTTLIGCEPTSARRKGEKISGRPKMPPARIGQWFLEAPKELEFAEKVQFLLESTEPNADVWQMIAQSHTIRLSCAIFLHSWTEGFVLSPGIMSGLAAKHWEFSLSMYSAEGDEIVDSFLRNHQDNQEGKDVN